MLEIIAEIGWDSALRRMESGGETFYIKKETMAQRLVPTLRVALQRERWISCGFSRALGCAVFRARVEKRGAEEEEENQDFCKDRGWSPLPRNFVAEFQREYREAWLHRICARRYGVHYALEKACNIICMPFACDLHIIFNERTRSSRFLLPMEKTTISPPVENVRFVDPSNRFRNTHEIGCFSN